MSLGARDKNRIARLVGEERVNIDTLSFEWDVMLYYFTAKEFGWTPTQTDTVPYKYLLAFLHMAELSNLEQKMRANAPV